jgi:hypothetical protein
VTPELKQRWLDALRSGKYKQGKGALRTGKDHFCCLGVLCDISGAGEWESGKYGWQYTVDDSSDSEFLPRPLAGLVLDEGHLASMNDCEKALQ